MSRMIEYKATLEDGRFFFVKYRHFGSILDRDKQQHPARCEPSTSNLQDMAIDALKQGKVSVPWGVVKTHRVKLDQLGTEEGVVVVVQTQCVNVPIPQARMTSEEFHKLETEELTQVPEEFRRFISQYAYELGHSSGMEAVFSGVQELVSQLKGPIKEFQKRVEVESH